MQKSRVESKKFPFQKCHDGSTLIFGRCDCHCYCVCKCGSVSQKYYSPRCDHNLTKNMSYEDLVKYSKDTIKNNSYNIRF